MYESKPTRQKRPKPVFSAKAITLASGHHFVTTVGVVEGLIFSRHQSSAFLQPAHRAPSAWLEILEEK